MIPYGRQDITQDDIDAVVDVLKSDFLTQGPTVPAFENALTQYCNAGHAVAMNSATSALHIACLALGLTTGDRVWTSPNSFVASANCALYCGASIDFVDVDVETGNMSIASLKEKLEKAQKDKTLPKIVIPVHFAGQPCDMAAINVLAKKYGFFVIEDAAHAIGAHDGQAMTGSCRYSDITIFSFHPVKLITCGEGGAALTNNPDLAEKMQLLRSHGVTRNHAQMKHLGRNEPWYYEQIALGLNYRMTDIQAALGISQLNRLEEFVRCRTALALRYDEKLAILGVEPLCWNPQSGRSALHLYVVRIEAPNQTRRSDIFKHLRSVGIGVNVHYIPIHTQPYFQKLGFKTHDFPNALKYYNGVLTLPLHPNLTHDQQDYVIDSLAEALRKY